jgi:hypothetical protein
VRPVTFRCPLDRPTSVVPNRQAGRFWSDHRGNDFPKATSGQSLAEADFAVRIFQTAVSWERR